MRLKDSTRCRCLWFSVLVSAAGCDSSASTGDAPDDPEVAIDAGTADAGQDGGGDSPPFVDASGGDSGRRADGGTAIAGMVNGSIFSTASTTFWIGQPDSPTTTVILVFDHPTTCAEVSSVAWDRRVTDHTQVLELNIRGMAAGDYPVIAGPLPGPGEASVNYTLSSRTVTPAETSSRSGVVTLTSLSPTRNAVGAFHLLFPSGGGLDGAFDAEWCPTGREP